MIVDPGSRCGIAFWQSQNMAYRLVFITRSNCSVVMSAMPPIWAIWYAALFTRMSIPPSSETAVSMIFWQVASSRMSPGHRTALRPAASTRRAVSAASASSLSR